MENQDLLSVKDFAKAAGVSRQAVYNQLDLKLKPFVVQVDKRKMIDKKGLLEFSNRKNLSSCQSSSQSSFSQVEQEKVDNKTLQKALEILQQEIENKNEQIKDLQQQLAAAYTQIGELAKAASYITAADKTEKIIDHQQKDLGEKPEIRKRWFQFWKK